MTEKLARGILPALCTPFDDSGQKVATERVAPLVGALIDAGSQGFFVCGGTGEGGAMTVPERKVMAETTAAANAGIKSTAQSQGQRIDLLGAEGIHIDQTGGDMG